MEIYVIFCQECGCNAEIHCFDNVNQATDAITNFHKTVCNGYIGCKTCDENENNNCDNEHECCYKCECGFERDVFCDFHCKNFFTIKTFLKSGLNFSIFGV